MAVDFDSKLTELAAQILRETVRTYSKGDVAAWLPGYGPATVAWNSVMFSGLDSASTFRGNTASFSALTGSLPSLTSSLPALTGSLPALTGSLPMLTGSFHAVGAENASVEQGTMRELLGLPPKLPGVLLPPDEVLASMARSAPTMGHLAALARWLGDSGRPVTDNDQLAAEPAAEVVRLLGIEPDYLPYLWEYGLVSGWIMLADDVDGHRSWAVPGATAYRWADSEVSGTLHVWAAVYAAVLAVTLKVATRRASDVRRWKRFQGQGVVLAVAMFLARQTGLTVADAAEIVRIGALGEAATGRERKAWSAWGSRFGDPARRLLTELAALRAVELPADGVGAVTLAPLAQWALRQQFSLDGISVPVVRAAAQRSVTDLVTIAGGLSEAEFEAEFQDWLMRHGPNRGAQELLLFAGSAGPEARLIATKLARRIGPAAIHAWVDAMRRRELRGYARIALSMMAADLPETSLPLVLNPDPDDLDGMATDLVLLMGGDDIPDPDRIEALFAEAVPKGEEEWVIALLSRARHRDVVRLLELLSHAYSDRRLARSARKAARVAAQNCLPASHDRVSARAAGR